MGHVTFTVSLNAFRFYNDSTTWNSNTNAVAAQNTNITRSTTTPKVVLPVRIQESGGAAGAIIDAYQLQVSKNGGAYQNVTTSSANVRAFDSANGFNGSSYTVKLTGGSGSGSGVMVETGLGGGEIPASGYFEFAFFIEIVPADVANGDTLDFRVLYNGATFSYNVTPRITVTVPSGTQTPLSLQASSVGVASAGSLFSRGVLALVLAEANQSLQRDMTRQALTIGSGSAMLRRGIARTALAGATVAIDLMRRAERRAQANSAPVAFRLAYKVFNRAAQAQASTVADLAKLPAKLLNVNAAAVAAQAKSAARSAVVSAQVIVRSVREVAKSFAVTVTSSAFAEAVREAVSTPVNLAAVTVPVTDFSRSMIKALVSILAPIASREMAIAMRPSAIAGAQADESHIRVKMQEVQAAVSTAVSLAKGMMRAVVVSAGVQAGLKRDFGRHQQATTSSQASLGSVKGLSQKLQASAAGQAALEVTKVFLTSVQALAGVMSSAGKGFEKQVQSIAQTAVEVLRSADLSVQALVTAATEARLNKAASRTATVQTAPEATASSLEVLGVMVQAVAAGSASLLRSSAKGLQASATAVGSVVRDLTKQLQVSAQGVASWAKTGTEEFFAQATVIATSTVSRASLIRLQAQAGAHAVILKAVTAGLSALSGAQVFLDRSAQLTLRTQTGPVGELRRTTGRMVVAVSDVAATSTAIFMDAVLSVRRAIRHAFWL